LNSTSVADISVSYTSKKNKIVETRQKKRIEPLIDVMDKSQLQLIIEQLYNEMKNAAKDLDFDRAAQLRDEINILKEKI